MDVSFGGSLFNPLQCLTDFTSKALQSTHVKQNEKAREIDSFERRTLTDFKHLLCSEYWAVHFTVNVISFLPYNSEAHGLCGLMRSYVGSGARLISSTQ